jgi:aryl-alcohol dehydrogenase-like predicted oxidoreductase
MAKLVSAGKVRHVGLCNVGTAELTRCMEIRPVDSFQGPYSPLRRRLEPEVLPFCREARIGVLPFGALGHGFLSGDFHRDRLASDDWRRKERWDDEIARGRALVERLRGLADRLGATVGQLTTAWVVDHPAVTATPIGTRSVQQARENFGGPTITGARQLIAEAVAELA